MSPYVCVCASVNTHTHKPIDARQTSSLRFFVKKYILLPFERLKKCGLTIFSRLDCCCLWTLTSTAIRVNIGKCIDQPKHIHFRCGGGECSLVVCPRWRLISLYHAILVTQCGLVCDTHFGVTGLFVQWAKLDKTFLFLLGERERERCECSKFCF